MVAISDLFFKYLEKLTPLSIYNKNALASGKDIFIFH